MVKERFLRYVRIATASAEGDRTLPSTDSQFVLGRLLVEELKQLGVEDARIDDKCYVYASLPATEGLEDKAAIGFIAHMDTSPDFNGENVNPIIHENYDGKNVVLGDSGRVLKVNDFKHLKKLEGRTLITTDGTSLLGADDKAGIAEIMTMVERLQKEQIPHGKVCIGFTPDEEIGSGADGFDVKEFGADFAYTADGGAEGELQFENFHAARLKVTLNGFNVHPGSAKNTMINACLLAMKFNDMLPKDETPRNTSGHQGFYHLCDMQGNVEKAVLHYIVRDHDRGLFMDKIDRAWRIEKLLRHEYGMKACKCNVAMQYKNMEEMIEDHYHLVDNAKEVMESLNIKPKIVPIRGGTDGARLSFMGLPCPNLGTGGYAYHGPYEHITVEGMEAATEILLGIVKKYAQFNLEDIEDTED
ncbi:MAG: peptidase T [Clostridia bacterium]|nr:peptidase T [Clostridia bacterium]